MQIQLSSRERQLVEMAAQGLTDKEICLALELSAGTVGTYWARCREKLGARTRASCVAAWLNVQSDASAENSRWSALLRTTSDAVVVLSSEGRVVQANPPASELANSTQSELIGLPLPETGVTLLDDAGETIGPDACPVHDCLRSGTSSIDRRYRIRAANGREMPARVSVRRIGLGDGEAEVLLVVRAGTA